MKKTLVAIALALTGHVLMADVLQDALNNQTLVFTTGGERFNLDSVELVVKPRFKLLWSTGSWDLTEMLSRIL